jgi:hypothetical protein
LQGFATPFLLPGERTIKAPEPFKTHAFPSFLVGRFSLNVPLMNRNPINLILVH